ncbi:hypothetical protein B0H13DRAFT_2327849 [Mycena leptocephala]|nr:hypothetical protein B0H13DRAFT_2327849 [Mycena leptocephala]
MLPILALFLGAVLSFLAGVAVPREYVYKPGRYIAACGENTLVIIYHVYDPVRKAPRARTARYHNSTLQPLIINDTIFLADNPPPFGPAAAPTPSTLSADELAYSPSLVDAPCPASPVDPPPVDNGAILRFILLAWGVACTLAVAYVMSRSPSSAPQRVSSATRKGETVEDRQRQLIVLPKNEQLVDRTEHMFVLVGLAPASAPYPTRSSTGDGVTPLFQYGGPSYANAGPTAPPPTADDTAAPPPPPQPPVDTTPFPPSAPSPPPSSAPSPALPPQSPSPEPSSSCRPVPPPAAAPEAETSHMSLSEITPQPPRPDPSKSKLPSRRPAAPSAPSGRRKAYGRVARVTDPPWRKPRRGATLRACDQRWCREDPRSLTGGRRGKWPGGWGLATAVEEPQADGEGDEREDGTSQKLAAQVPASTSQKLAAHVRAICRNPGGPRAAERALIRRHLKTQVELKSSTNAAATAKGKGKERAA